MSEWGKKKNEVTKLQSECKKITVNNRDFFMRI